MGRRFSSYSPFENFRFLNELEETCDNYGVLKKFVLSRKILSAKKKFEYLATEGLLISKRKIIHNSSKSFIYQLMHNRIDLK